MEHLLQFVSIVFIATFLSILMRILRQPLVVGYILTGIFVGPQMLNLTESQDYIELFSKIGIIILLFIVGLNLSPKVIKEVGKVSFLGGLAQIALTALYGTLLTVILGISWIPALFIGVGLSFSSTIIILKLLSDKGDLPKLYGKVTIGFLIVQDLVAIAILVFVSSVSAGSESLLQTSLFLLGKLLVMGILLFILAKMVFPKALHALADSQELLFLFSITWGLGLASVFHVLGFSVEVGALLAGVTLSVSPYADGIASRLKPLRDFFIVLFFILLGSQLALGSIGQVFVPAILLSLFVLIGKPLIVFFLLNILGFKTKQGFQVGIALAQISEFSLIVATLGMTTGQLDGQALSLLTLIALITIPGSSYLIAYTDKLYKWLEPVLKKLEINHKYKTIRTGEAKHELVLFGFDRVGHTFVDAFSKFEKDFVIVDYNPEMISHLENASLPFRYGDIEDLEFLGELQLQKIKLCVSTIPNLKANMLLLKHIREVNQKAIVLVRAHDLADAKKLYELGATYVIMPHYLGAKYATSMIGRIGLDPKGFEEEREKHLVHVNKA